MPSNHFMQICGGAIFGIILGVGAFCYLLDRLILDQLYERARQLRRERELRIKRLKDLQKEYREWNAEAKKYVDNEDDPT